MAEKQKIPEFSEPQRQKVIIIAALVTAMGFIDATALNVALPFIQSSLNASATDIHWVLEIYLLFLAALMMAGGALGDTLGRRRPLRWGVAFFALTSFACAVSPSAEWLIFFRAAQGISAALMVPASLALINAAFPPDERGIAIGRWSAIVAIAIPIGPLVGGLAVDYLSWHFVFLLNLPISLIVLGMLASLPRPPFEPAKPLPLDIYGSVLITAALGLITYGLLEAGREGYFHPIELIVLVVGTVLLGVFFWAETKIKTAMLPVSLMKDRRFVLVSVQTLVLFAGFQSAMYFLSFLYIQAFGYSALQAGAASLPISVIVFFISARAGRMATIYGPRLILFSSAALMSISLFWLSFADGDYLRSVFPGMIVMGFAVGLFAAPLTTVAMAAAGPGRDGLASGVNNAVSRIGPLLGIAVFGYWIGGDYAANLTAALGDTSLSPDKQAFLIDNRAMIAAITLPADWPVSEQENIMRLIRGLFASSLQETLRISALFAAFAAVLALFYRKNDARSE
jgi:EmrB/QacA subfamily drug resistance transporter